MNESVRKKKKTLYVIEHKKRCLLLVGEVFK